MCRRANVVAHQRPQKIGFLGRRTLTDGGLDVWRDPIDDRFDVSGIRTVAGPDGVDGRRDGATTRMAKHHNQAGTELRGRELDGPDDRRGHHVSGNSDDEEIAEALIEKHFDGRARIGAAEHDGEGALRLLGQVGGENPGRVDGARVAEALVTFGEAVRCIERRK